MSPELLSQKGCSFKSDTWCGAAARGARGRGAPRMHGLHDCCTRPSRTARLAQLCAKGTTPAGRPPARSCPRRSLGCAFYELTAQRPAFNAFNIHGLVTKIRRHRMAPLPAGYSADWGALISL